MLTWIFLISRSRGFRKIQFFEWWGGARVPYLAHGLFLSVYFHLCHLWNSLASFSLLILPPSDETFHPTQSILIDLYFFLPSSVCTAFHFCHSFMVSIISLVVHGLDYEVKYCLKPTTSVATSSYQYRSLKSVQLTSGLSESVKGLTSHSTHNRSFQRRVFPGNQLHWYLTTKNNQTQHYIHQKQKRETEKTALANKTIYTLIWYAYYDLRSGNGVGPILTAPEPTRGLISRLSTDLFYRLLQCQIYSCSELQRGEAAFVYICFVQKYFRTLDQAGCLTQSVSIMGNAFSYVGANKLICIHFLFLSWLSYSQ